MAKGVKRSIYLYINGEEVENDIKTITARMSKLINEQKKMTIGSDEYIAHAQKIKQLRGVLDEHNRSLRSSQSNWEKLKNTMGNLGSVITGATLGLQSLNQVIGSLKKMATDLAAMDDIYADVMKYTGMTKDAVEELNDEFKKMDSRTPREQLNKLAGDAGRLGIQGKEKILEFVQAADKINVALGEDLGADAVKNIGKMAEMFGEVEKKGLREAMLATGSAINTLGQTSSAAEPYLLEFAARLSGTANQAKITQAEVLGYASVLDQNMQQLEMSATAIQNLIMKMMQTPAKFAKMAGMEVSKFSELLKTDANEAVLALIDSLSKKGGLSELAPMFKEMGLDGVRASGVISVLANNIDKIRIEQEKATQAYNDGTSVINEYNIKNNNLQAELEKSRKKFQDMKLELGEKLYPILINLTKTSTGFIKLIGQLSTFISTNKGLVIALASAWGAYLTIMVRAHVAKLAFNAATKISTSLMAIHKTAVLATSLAYNTMTGKATRAAAAQKMLKVAMSSTPWGAILAAVSAIGVGIYTFATRQTEAQKNMKEFNSEMAKQSAEAVYLFNELRKTTKGSEDYNKQLKKLKDIYPDIIQSHLDEKGALIDINDAYIDVIESIYNKVSMQMKEKALTEAIAKDVENQANAIGSLRQKMTKKNISASQQDDFIEYLKSLVDEGESFIDIYPKLQAKFGSVTSKISGFFSNKMSKEINKMLESSKDLKTSMTLIDQQFSKTRDKTGISGESMETEIQSGNKGLSPIDENYETKYKAYLERLSNFRNKHLFDKQSDFIKEIANTKSAYDEMIAMATEFHDKENMLTLEEEKQEAIEALVFKFADNIANKMAELTDKSTQNPLLDAIAGERKKYDDVIREMDKLISTLTELNELEANPEIVKTIEDLWLKREAVVTERTQVIQDIINKYTKEISDSVLSESEKEIKAIEEQYNKEIEIIKAAIEEKKRLIGSSDDLTQFDEEIKQLEALIVKLENLRNKDIKKVERKGSWEIISDFLGIKEDQLKDVVKEMESFYNSISSSFLKISENRNNKELKDFKDKQDKERKLLEENLSRGIISQEQYNNRIAELDEKYNKKELGLKREQFKKEKKAAIFQALINAALSITEIWAKVAGAPYIAGALSAIAAAATGIQIAAIQSEPEPYEKGGYIRKEKIIKIAEKNKPEWVASNTLLTNPITSPIIRALDDYQKGRKSSFNALGFSVPSISSEPKANFYSNQSTPNTQQPSQQSRYDDAVLYELMMLRKFTEDPRNRQAIISRKIQTKFEMNESQLNNIANL